MANRFGKESQFAPRGRARRGEMQGGAILLLVIVLLLILGLVIALRPKPAERAAGASAPAPKPYAQESQVALLGDFPGADAIKAAIAAVPGVKAQALGADFDPARGAAGAREIGAAKKATLVAWAAEGAPEAHFEILRAPRYVEILHDQGCRALEVPEIDSLTARAAEPYAAELAAALVRDQAGDTSETLAAYSRVLTALGDADTTSAATIRVMRANAALVARDADEALADYDRAIELLPSHPFALAGRSAVRTLKGDYAGAIEDGRKAVSISSGVAATLVNAGLAAHMDGDAQKAAEAYEAVLQVRPDDAAALLNRCHIYFINRKDRQAAEADVKRVIELAPQLAGAYYNRGWLHMLAERAGEAIVDYSEAIRRAPEFTAAWYKRANAHNTAGLMSKDGGKAHYQKAVEDYGVVIDREPNNVKAFNNRGAAYGSLRDWDRAIKDFTRAIELLPIDAQIYYNRGMAYVEKGDAEAAKKDLYKSIEITKDGQQKIRAMGELEKLGEKFADEGPIRTHPEGPPADLAPTPAGEEKPAETEAPQN